MPSEVEVPKRKIPFAKLAILAAVALLVVAVVLQLIGWQTVWVHTKQIFAQLMIIVASAGPALFFTAMALLPVFGAPMSVFSITGGLVFRDKLGLPATLALGLVAFWVNITLSYWLARRGLRPWLTRWLTRSGYNLPNVAPADLTDFIILVRVTPGPPFFVQNYLLGLADAPYGRYMAISSATQGLLVLGFMVFGDALNQGRGRTILFAVLALATLVVGIHLVRKHMAKKRALA